MSDRRWILGGLQQIGVGVQNNPKAVAFYKDMLGFDIPMFDEQGVAALMKRYTGGEAWERHATFSVNLRGGGGMEIWQYVSRSPEVMEQEVALNSLGIIAPHIRCKNIHLVREQFLKSNYEVSKPCYAPDGALRCFVRDIEYNWLCLVETNKGWFLPPKKSEVRTAYAGGVCGAIIGVSDMDRSVEFYKKILGYDEVIYDQEEEFSDFDVFLKQQKVRRVLLQSSTENKGIFAHLLTSSQIELVEAKKEQGTRIFEGRYWGDLGFIHICFDVRNMDALKTFCKEEGYPFTVDTGATQEFSMDDASGRFAYLEDPDGTLVEFVEVYKMPIIQKFGLILDLRKRRGKPLPKIMMKALKFQRKKK